MIQSGNAYCWGANATSQLGNGGTAASLFPTAVTMPTGVTFTQITAGNGDACGLGSNGQAYCWGDNTGGKIGLGAAASASTPTPVSFAGASSVAQISLGYHHGCALATVGASTGVAYCFGFGTVGQLGNGTGTSSTTPVTVSTAGTTPTTYSQIAAGDNFTCGLAATGPVGVTAGTAWCWGDNIDGDVGNNLPGTQENSPVQVSSSTVFSGITAGFSHACALTAAGATYCWGLNANGQLGDGTTTERDVPTLAASGLTLTQISAGQYDTCAIASGGQAYCWGKNNVGQVGDGNLTDPTLSPAAVSGAGTDTQISAGIDYACAQAVTGAVYCWGNNPDGELGNNTSGNHSDVAVLAGPGAPTGVSAVAGNTTAAVSWSPASLDGETLTSYTATASGGGTCTTAGTTCTITGLTNCTFYIVRVVTNTLHGPSSVPSTAAFVTPTAGSCGGGGGSGYFRHVANGHQSLTQFALARGSTALRIATVTESSGCPINARNRARFVTYVHHGVQKTMPAGLVFYTRTP